MGHTPGPWSIGAKPGNEGEAWEIASESRCVAWTASTWDDDEGDAVTAEDDANARLIAAAPELLSALRRMREVFEQLADGDWRHMDATYVDQLIESDGLHGCDQVIAKAEGRSVSDANQRVESGARQHDHMDQGHAGQREGRPGDCG